MKKFIATWFVIGLNVSAALLAVYWIILRPLHISGVVKNGFETIELILWPSSFWLMATRGTDLASLLILAESILANGILYALISLPVYALKHFVFRSKSRPQSAQ